MEPGLVSVMMPAYNAERYIRPAMESLLAQTYSRWELIVVNDGSKDATAAIARSFDDPRIRVIDQPNGGEASARNTALRTMRGEFVAFLDADDAYLPEHLETAAGFLVWNKDFDAAYTDGLHCDENGVRLQSLSSRRLSPQDGNIFDQVVRASCMLGPPVCLVLRREPILQRELWFDFAITIGPDWDFFTRYAEKTRFHYIDRQTCLYRIHASNISSAVGNKRRFADLALCRRKAMQLDSFENCTLETRIAFFYEFLVDLLLGNPTQQAEVVAGEQFKKLPIKEQGRILRLMASKAILYAEDRPFVATWLQQARALEGSDSRTLLISALWAISPAMCQAVLRVRTAGQVDPRLIHPFADIAGGPADRAAGGGAGSKSERESRTASREELLGAGK